MPLFRTTHIRVTIPAASGITTNSKTESSKVAHGIATPPTPSNNATIGAKATNIIKSFTATCTNV